MARQSTETEPLHPGGGDPFGVPWTALLEVKKASQDLRRGFVRKVYGILSMQLLLTGLIAAPFQLMDDQWLGSNAWLLWLSLVLTTVLMCALSCSPQLARTHPANEILLFLFTAFEGVVAGFVSAIYTWQSVLLAVGVLVLIVFGLTVYAVFTQTDFTGMGVYLFGASLTVLTFACTLMILSACGVKVEMMVVLLDLACILLFITYIIHDTQLILGSCGGHQHQFTLDGYVFAALSLYLDIINLFLHILSLLGEND